MGKPFLLLAMIAAMIIVTAPAAHAESGDKARPKTQPTVVTPEPTKHTVAEGEYLELIGQHYSIEWLKIWQKNPQLQNQDVINVGDVLVIPSKEETLTDRPLATIVAPAPVATVQTPNAVQNSTLAVSPGNTYAPGYCTWGVKNWKPTLPNNWGNANQWDDSARAMGIAVNGTPAVGAIAQTDAGGWGHVALVVGVNGNTVTIQEMNGNYVLFSVQTRSTSASEFNYIHL